MDKYINLELPSGAIISVARVEGYEAGVDAIAPQKQDEVHGVFEEYIAPIGEVADVMLKKFLGSVRSPCEVNLEFGVGFKGKTGLIIMSGEASADIKVKLIWKNEV